MSTGMLLSAVACALAAVQAIAEPLPTPTATPPPYSRCDLDPVPSAAPPGAAVALAGTCYPIHSGRPGVIFFDDAPVAHVRGDTPGTYSTGFEVPADASAGAHEITLRLGEDDGPVAARVRFEVLPFCRGDCNDDGRVTVAEVLVGVSIALRSQTRAACPRLDPDNDGVVRIDDLIGAIADLLSGCLAEFTPTATPCDTPTPLPLGAACRATDDCERLLLCLEPGGSAGCSECHDIGDECGSDDDCAARGAGLVCTTRPMLGRDCLCTVTRLCLPGCTGDADCDEAQRCDATSHCVDLTCASNQDCPTYFGCAVAVGTCKRLVCFHDTECASGHCVNRQCYDALGTCTLRPGVPEGSAARTR